MNDLRQKFSRMETELNETRAEMELMKSQAPSFSSIVSRRPIPFTGANRQEQEVGAGLADRLVGGRREEVRGQESEGGDSREIGSEEQVRRILERARRTIGFKRIGEDDVQRMYKEAVPYGGATTREQAVLMTVREFMDCELKIKHYEQQSMEIEEVFERKGAELDTIYVRFKFRSSLSKIFDKIRILEKHSQIVTYIPREFQDRFKALNAILKPLREEGEGWRTRVKVGQDDLIVAKKKKERGAIYENVEIDMSCLPPPSLTRPRAAMSDSPPQGRPGHGWEEGGKRRRSGQKSGSSPINKAQKNHSKKSETEDEEEMLQEAVNNSNITMRKTRNSRLSPTIIRSKGKEGLLVGRGAGSVSRVECTENEQTMDKEVA